MDQTKRFWFNLVHKNAQGHKLYHISDHSKLVTLNANVTPNCSDYLQLTLQFDIQKYIHEQYNK